ncbi:unnamed protein product [Aureobasidium uvarum]|uniref:DUF7587 domain-containing protein n=1 Tax=Aureobasidium uvarum TaxID=2773716 RepID=A0A9N8KD00_9PEZI|nr:unnamed protein product [Aureobasidium uvarum]
MSKDVLALTPIVRVFDACPASGQINLYHQSRESQSGRDKDVHDNISYESQSTESVDSTVTDTSSPSSTPDTDTIVVAPVQQSESQQLTARRALGSQPQRRGCGNSYFKYREEHHITLYLLRTTIKGSWNQTTRCFNVIYQEDIANYGLERGLLPTALKSQFAFRRTSQRSLWETFLKQIKDDSCAFGEIKNRIETTLPTDATPDKALRSKKKTRRFGITREDAHPPLPVVLFRAYNDASQGSNSSEGFVASYFEGHDSLPPPPNYSNYDLENTIRKHISQHQDFKSPLISTGSCLVKLMRRAMKASARANDLKSCRIGIIDTQKVAQDDGIFYARPYRDLFRSIKKLFPWRYSAEEEYLVWGSIPKAAILADLSLQDLLSFIAEDFVLSHAFDTDISSGRVEQMCRTLKCKKTLLSSELTAGIACLVAFLGMEINTLPAIIAKLVCEVLHGWFIVLPVQSREAWLAEAAVFAHNFVDSQECVVVGHEEMHFTAICQAFLAGARTSLKSWAAHIEIDQNRAQVAIDRAIKVGLLDAEERVAMLEIEGVK